MHQLNVVRKGNELVSASTLRLKHNQTMSIGRALFVLTKWVDMLMAAYEKLEGRLSRIILSSSLCAFLGLAKSVLSIISHSSRTISLIKLG